MRRLAAISALVGTLALGACDPNSPVDPSHSPTYGVVLEKDDNSYFTPNGPEFYYYLRVRTNYGAYWVEVTVQQWVECQRYETWTRILGCR